MATTKTLTPTNQAITLAAFTEKPDNRTNVTNDDKLADAVNALNSNLVTFVNAKIKAVTLEKTVNSGYFTIDVESEFGSGYIPCMVMTVYKSGAVSSQLNLCYTLDSSNVYVRTGSGEQLANGTVIKVSVMAIKMIS